VNKRSILVLLLTLVVLAFALITGFALLLRLFYLLALTVAGSYLWSWLNLRWLETSLERRTPRVHVGELVEERITVHNSSVLPKPWLEITDLTDIPGHNTGHVVGLSPREFRSWRTRTVARRRGVYTLGPLRIATGDPFGIFRLERFSFGQEQVVVLPSVVPIPRFFIPSSDLAGEGQLRLRYHQVSPHVSSIREYVPGDPLTRIHWASTARIGRLMVKEFDVGLTSDVWVVLDMAAASHTAVDDDSTEELAVTAAASLAHYFTSRGLPVGFAATNKDFLTLPPTRSAVQDGRILDLLAQARADGETPLAQVLPRLDQWLGRDTTLVLVTASADPAWLDGMGVLTHRGVRAAVVLVDAAGYGGRSAAGLAGPLRSLGVTPYVVGRGENLAVAFDHPVTSQWDAGQPAGTGGRP